MDFRNLHLQGVNWKLILYIERKAPIGSAEAARAAGSAEASSASSIMIRTAVM
jgi:hypothetical protein